MRILFHGSFLSYFCIHQQITFGSLMHFKIFVYIISIEQSCSYAKMNKNSTLGCC